jgi:hypothetical protein
MKVDNQAIKRIGASGQISLEISLGKEFAGHTVLVNNPEPGVWLIKTAQTIPNSELWLHEPEAAAQLDRAMARCKASPHQKTPTTPNGSPKGADQPGPKHCRPGWADPHGKGAAAAAKAEGVPAHCWL